MKQFFMDESGKYSSTRLVFLIWSLGLFVVWSIISLKKKEIASLPLEIILLIGTFMSGKVIQTFREFKGMKSN